MNFGNKTTIGRQSGFCLPETAGMFGDLVVEKEEGLSRALRRQAGRDELTLLAVDFYL